ncbi:MAG: hypothetical protein Q8K00_12250 [Syntrophales bacterium]|nr:hypothetical protein [Syntrophales bacterium]
MNPTKGKPSLRTPAFKKEEGRCVIPGAMPAEALADYVLKTGDDAADGIRSYVEWQAPDEKVRHIEKVASESIFGQEMDAWDVRTDKGRWWVITNPTNLYSQKLFPSLDYTLSFHVGVTTRMMQSEMSEEQEIAHNDINVLWYKLARARATLFSAHKAEDFQSVGMKCRECLLLLVQTFGKAEMVPEGQEVPQRGNFTDWCELIADYIAAGASNERLRSYIKTVSRSTWQLVNWLTHEQNAGRHDGSIATEATENVLSIFVIARTKNEGSKTGGKKARGEHKGRSHLLNGSKDKR